MNAESKRAHYQRNRAAMKAKARAITPICQKRNRDYVLAYLCTHPCVDCANNDVRVLEFDHRDASQKVGNVSQMVLNAVSLKRLAAEISKCDVRCANCHRIKTRRTLWNKDSMDSGGSPTLFT